MSYFDILFPVNLPPLTYKIPEGLLEKTSAGTVVSAPLKNKVTRGIIIGPNLSPPQGRIREIAGIERDVPVIEKPLLKLLQWISQYYLASPGTVLKYTVPAEIFSGPWARKRSGRKVEADPPSCLKNIEENDFTPLIRSLSEKKYRTFLAHAPSSIYEYSIPLKLSGITGNIIVVAPEVSRADFLYNEIEKAFPGRACLLHGRVSKGMRAEYVEGVITGKYDIVIGTTPALFAPLKGISLIMVLQEHSDSYKIEEGFSFQTRDVAVMRGFLEKCAVLLTSITPSVNSYYNALYGKYSLLRPPAAGKRPRTRIIDMRFENKVRPNISKTIYEAARRKIAQDKRIIFSLNRKGYSNLLLCSECGNIEKCPVCNIPLVMHKREKVLKCRYCGCARDIPDHCGKCGSFRLELLGAGTEKISQEIGDLLGVPTFRFDSDILRKRSEVDTTLRQIYGGGASAVIGTRMMTKHLRIQEKFGMAAALNADGFMYFPDFRAQEKTYMEMAALLDLLEPEGEMLIQTRFPQSSFFRYFREDDYLSMIKEELQIRKSLLYPPFYKLLNVRFTGSLEYAGKIEKTLRRESAVEVMGPATIRNNKGLEEHSFLLRARDGNLLRKAAAAAAARWGKEIRLVFDVDP